MNAQQIKAQYKLIVLNMTDNVFADTKSLMLNLILK